MSMPKGFAGRPSAQTVTTLTPSALSKWEGGLHAASDSDNDIGIYDVIGEDWSGAGMTARRVAGILRNLGETADVNVIINSPGGDMFEGMAIYNILREHKGRVTVKIVGLAASAASIVAMAGDNVQIARAGFLMIHNAWTYAPGNRHDFRELADYLEPFDKSMSDIYKARTGLENIAAMMDAETYIGGETAVEQGFADELLPSDQVVRDDTSDKSAVAKLDRALATTGMPRSQRRQLLQAFKNGTHNAAEDDDMPSAVKLDEIKNMADQLRSVFQ